MSENWEPARAGEVVAGIDGSEHAMCAAEWAAAEAVARGTLLALVHATSVPGQASLENGEIVERAREQGRALLLRALGRVHDRFPDLSVRTEISAFTPARMLSELSTTASLVVTGARGRGGFGGMQVGSVSRKLAVYAHCPLVVVRDWLPHEMLDEVVLGVEPDQEPAPIRFAFEAAARYSAALHAVRVWHPQTLYSSVPGGYCEDLAQVKLEQIGAVEEKLEPHAADHPEVKVEISTGRGNTVPVLAETARGTRLLVVGADRYRGPLSVGAGYVVDGLLAHAATPVAVVPIR